MASDVPELLFDLARAALEHQERQVSELRSRTQTLLGAAALIASFLGSTAIGRDGLQIAAIAALGALGLTLGASLHLLLPQATTFTLKVGELRLDEGAFAPLEAFHLAVASRLQTMHRRNQPALERMAWTFSCATAMLVLQIALWGLALVVG